MVVAPFASVPRIVRTALWAGVAACFGLLLSCDSETPDPKLTQPTPADLFGPTIRSVAFEVDYVAGAEPSTGDTIRLFVENAQRLFRASGKTVSFPTELASMQRIDDVSGSEFTAQEILEIAARHRDETSSGSRATFYVLYLNGYLRDDEGVQKAVLGASIGQTGVIAMFHPVIATLQNPAFPFLSRFAEQSTLLHEFGHAVGMVNNGLPMTTPHQDVPKGPHCSNSDCVMYWANEGAVDAVEALQRYLKTGNSILFGAECLADADAAGK